MACAERIDRSLWMRDARQDERRVHGAADAAGGSRDAVPGAATSGPQSGVADESLVYGIVHDLRTPMAAILASLEQMEMMERAGAGPGGTGGESLERSIERVRASAARMAETIESLLGLAQARGPRDQAMERVDAAALAREVLHELGVLADRAGVTLAFDEPPAASSCESRGGCGVRRRGGQCRSCRSSSEAQVWCEPAVLRRCLQNVIANAIKFTALVEGERRVSVGVRRALQAHDGVVRIEVMDTGPGIPPEKLELVFTPFARIASKGRGTGLGLAIVREHVLAMGGRVLVESDGKHGTRVVMEFRAADAGQGRAA